MSRVIAQDIPGAGLGNKMFINALAYIIASKTGKELITTPIDFFKNTKVNTVARDINNPYFTRQHGEQFVDIDDICKHSGDIIINSFVQRQEYYAGYREELREFFVEATIDKKHNDTVLYIRNGDYKDIGVYLGIDNYRKILNSIDHDNIIIVVEHIDEDIRALQREYNTKIQCSSILNDFLCIANAKKIIMSQSTFSWWAAFLGEPDEVYIPLSQRNISKGWWYTDPGIDDIDLSLRYDNYKYILLK